MTGSQTIGWSWKVGNENFKKDQRWRAVHKQSDIVSYADNYVLSFGKSPYCKNDWRRCVSSSIDEYDRRETGSYMQTNQAYIHNSNCKKNKDEDRE